MKMFVIVFFVLMTSSCGSDEAGDNNESQSNNVVTTPDNNEKVVGEDIVEEVSKEELDFVTGYYTYLLWRSCLTEKFKRDLRDIWPVVGQSLNIQGERRCDPREIAEAVDVPAWRGGLYLRRIRSGRARVDLEEFKSCLNSIVEQFDSDSDNPNGDYIFCDDGILPNVPEGGSCEVHDDCERGLGCYILDGDACDARCMQYPDYQDSRRCTLTEVCNSDEYCDEELDTCLPFKNLGEACVPELYTNRPQNRPCQPGLFCDTETNVCTTEPAVGDPCILKGGVEFCGDGKFCCDNFPCAFSGECVANGVDGERCPCAEGFVCKNPENICEPVRSEGDECRKFEDCESHLSCVNDACAPITYESLAHGCDENSDCPDDLTCGNPIGRNDDRTCGDFTQLPVEAECDLEENRCGPDGYCRECHSFVCDYVCEVSNLPENSPCEFGRSCATGTFCRFAEGAILGTCVQNEDIDPALPTLREVEDGGECEPTDFCPRYSSCVDGFCAAGRGLNEECSGLECQEGLRCHAQTQTCVELKLDGESCEEWWECADKICEQGRCGLRACGEMFDRFDDD